MSGAAARAGAEPTREPERKVYYLAQDDLYEAQVARAWAKEHGKSIVHWIPIERLTNDMVIVPICRNAEERTHVIYEEWNDQQHKKVTLRRDPATLTSEIVECTPVRVSDYWRGSGAGGRRGDPFAEMLMGELSRDGFIDAVNASTREQGVYPRTHHGDGDAKLKLTWGA